MSRTLFSMLAIALAAGMVLCFAASANADKTFRDQFIAKYVKSDSSDPKDQAFATACEQAKCNICHAGVSKKDRNDYGKALDKLLDRKTDKGNAKKILSALDTVARMKSDPKDPNSPTFGDLIKAGKLPGAQPKDTTAAVH